MKSSILLAFLVIAPLALGASKDATVESYTFQLKMDDLESLSGLELAAKQTAIIKIAETYFSDNASVICDASFKLYEQSILSVKIDCNNFSYDQNSPLFSEEVQSGIAKKIYISSGYVTEISGFGITGVMIGSNGSGGNER